MHKVKAMMSISPAAIQRNTLSSPRNPVWLALLETVTGLSAQMPSGRESQDLFLYLPYLKCWKAKLSRKGMVGVLPSIVLLIFSFEFRFRHMLAEKKNLKKSVLKDKSREFKQSACFLYKTLWFLS